MCCNSCFESCCASVTNAGDLHPAAMHGAADACCVVVVEGRIDSRAFNLMSAPFPRTKYPVAPPVLLEKLYFLWTPQDSQFSLPPLAKHLPRRKCQVETQCIRTHTRQCRCRGSGPLGIAWKAAGPCRVRRTTFHQSSGEGSVYCTPGTPTSS